VGVWNELVRLRREEWRAHLNAVMNLQVPLNAEKFLSGCTTGGILSSAHLDRVS
jgi:hypothetical protein